MSFKEYFSQKLLNKSQSYNYYKNKCEHLSEEINNYQNDINDLEKQLKLKDIESNKLKSELFNLEEGFIFSIVIAVYNTEKYVAEAIESIINQTFDFNKVQIILVDDGSTDNSGNICLDYANKFPDNIVYVHQENNGQANARNNGLEFCKGKYVNFLDSDDKLESNALEEVYLHFIEFQDEIDVISIPRYLFGAIDGPMEYHHKYNQNRVVDIYEEFDFPQVSISAAFIRKSALAGKFDERVIISEDSLLLNSTILKKCKFGVLGSTRYLYRKRHEQNSTIDTKKIKLDYFNPRMEYYFKNLINTSIKLHGGVLKYIQVVLMYDLQWLFKQNTEKDVLNDTEKKEFYNHIFDVIQKIDDEIIMLDSFNFSNFLRYHILKFKYPDLDLKIESFDDDDDAILVYKNKKFDVLSDYKINLTSIDEKNDNILIKGFLKFYPFDVRISAYADNQPLDIILDYEYDEFSMGSPVSAKLKFETVLEHPAEVLFEINVGITNFVSKIDCSKLKSNVKVDMDEYKLII